MKIYKELIRKTLRKYGYEIRKFPNEDFTPISVFDLAVELLQQKKHADSQGKALQFIQIGANDGIFDDPLRKFVTKYAWHGILVEPQFDVYNKLVENYRDFADHLIFQNIAISPTVKEMEMYRLKKGYDSGSTHSLSVSSTDRKVTAQQLKVKPGLLESFKIKCCSLDELIANNSFDNFDLLQIDAEGYDWQILSSISLAKYSPTLIQFEHGHLSLIDCNNATGYLQKNGYDIYWGGRQGNALADTLAIKRGRLT